MAETNLVVKVFYFIFGFETDGAEQNNHIASVPIQLLVLNNVYIVCLSIEINMVKLNRMTRMNLVFD